jgi:hypothetical protein
VDLFQPRSQFLQQLSLVSYSTCSALPPFIWVVSHLAFCQ